MCVLHITGCVHRNSYLQGASAIFWCRPGPTSHPLCGADGGQSLVGQHSCRVNVVHAGLKNLNTTFNRHVFSGVKRLRRSSAESCHILTTVESVQWMKPVCSSRPGRCMKQPLHRQALHCIAQHRSPANKHPSTHAIGECRILTSRLETLCTHTCTRVHAYMITGQTRYRTGQLWSSVELNS
jgi:hypothetical protein